MVYALVHLVDDLSSGRALMLKPIEALGLSEKPVLRLVVDSEKDSSRPDDWGTCDDRGRTGGSKRAAFDKVSSNSVDYCF